MQRIRTRRLTASACLGPICAALTVIGAPGISAAQSSGGPVPIESAQVPRSVAAQVQCGTDPDDVTRRPFASGFVFAWKCASNHANWNQAQVYAETADGAGARLLRFPRPGSAEPTEELSNVRWYPAAREVTELSVDPESV